MKVSLKWISALLLVVVMGVVADLTTTCASDHLTVSGLSAGAFMSVQMQVAFSSQIAGSGVVAGGPFYCAKDTLPSALTDCMNMPSNIDVSALQEMTMDMYTKDHSIDNPANLKNVKTLLYSGTEDSVVKHGVALKLHEFYEKFIPSRSIKTVFDVASEHAMITDKYGNDCSYLGSPFINNCGYNLAQDIFEHIYGQSMSASGAFNQESLFSFDQSKYIPNHQHFGLPSSSSSLDKKGFMYVPKNCQKSSGTCVKKCPVHVAFHGCKQCYSKIKYDFIKHAGYVELAEANDIIIVFPQTVSTWTNMNACFDWWGYTNSDYANKNGIQTNTTMSIVSAVQSSRIHLSQVDA
eukprot:TRINITY_DN40083_c0_g1_i1.p1 TRINITY_DN40083_c0_g1~~TRINITY_DN40083_c0_g1_i1.p1  ORF type:complete len:350 (+),score=92.63 TRINITY_DN40083_c0_g1_i1:100-1149(+)